MNINQQAAGFLAALENGSAIEGGLAFQAHIREAELDYSMASLDRVDALLDRIRETARPAKAEFHAETQQQNFTLLLAFYLGAAIAKEGNASILWYGYEEAIAVLPPEPALPRTSWSRVVGLLGETVCVPLGLIEDRLFSDGPHISCRSYIDNLAERLNTPVAVDQNLRCKEYLDAFFSTGTLPHGLAFREELQKAGLDYSAASLLRLDATLATLRGRGLPAFDTFISQADTRNFLLLLNYYLGSTLARLGQVSMKWLDYTEARARFSDIGFRFETHTSCLLAGLIYFPLGVLTEILFDPSSPRSLSGYGQNILAACPPPLPLVRRESFSVGTEADVPEVWQQALKHAGFLAAHSMHLVEGGSDLAPIVLVPVPGGKTTFQQILGDDALERADKRIRTNPDKADHQVMVSDGYANLATGRTDALTLDIRCYAGGFFARKKPLEMKVALPYRNAQQQEGFAIFTPRLLGSSAPAGANGRLFRLFYEGVDSYRSSSFSWKQYLDESV
ncbi:MAG: hypothetical protein V4505_07110 [Pseudomonadota bacterium]